VKNAFSPKIREWASELRLQTIRFRPVRPVDAGYILSLRIDPRYNQHLSAPPPSIEAQEAWISRYLEREEAGEEYYFVIEKLGGAPCGTVRLYDFRDGSFSWGSWILDNNKTRYAALESALLVYSVGFDYLEFPRSHFDVRLENTKVISFHRKMGAVIINSDELNVYMILEKQIFETNKPRLLSIVSSD
jgi:RimJ/RimL family protein N-acetyltransferase